jgi:hypothetical protein
MIGVFDGDHVSRKNSKQERGSSVPSSSVAFLPFIATLIHELFDRLPSESFATREEARQMNRRTSRRVAFTYSR